MSQLLERARLVSLTGAGGSGKTRVALEVTSESASRFPDGVAWVDLASVSNPALLAQRVETAVGILHEEQRGSHEALISGLASRSLLLVLDSAEHLVDACAELAEELLVGCPGVRILVTTREALGISGEHAWHLPPLSLPEERPTSLEALRSSEAARLFEERARAARSDFAVSDDNLEPIARICRRLDGVPLAIELAAARVRALSPHEIAERLDHAFRLLAQESRTSVPRHRTLRAAIDWSYDLLSEENRAFLARLSVFRGEFPLSAIEAVCGPDEDPFQIFDRVSRLVDRSLLQVREGRGSVRYRLLETVRQYADEKLGDEPERRSLTSRHARYFLSVARESEAFLTTVSRREWVDRLGREVDNLRQALTWSLNHDPRTAVELTAALTWFWLASRHWWEGRRWSEAALAHTGPEEHSRARALLLFTSGALTCLQGRPAAALPRLEESAAIAQELEDDRLIAYALTYQGLALALEGDPEAGTPLDAALAWFQSTREPHGLRLALLLKANLALAQGSLEEGETLARQALEVARGFGADRELAVTLQTLALVAFEQSALDRALKLARESLQTLRSDPFDLFAARGLEIHAAIGLSLGNWEQAVPLAGTADAARASVDALPFGLDIRRLEPLLARARSELGAGAFEHLWLRGRDTPLDRAIDEVLQIVEPPPLPSSSSSPPTSPSRPDPLPASRRDAILRVLALGPLEIFREGVALEPEVWRLQKSRELLVYLLCHPRGRTREQVGSAFWPEQPPPQVKNSFHVTLHHLRKALGGVDRIVIDGDRYRVSPELEPDFDAARFEEAMKSVLAHAGAPSSNPDPLRSALSIYRGEFLEEEGAGEWHVEHRDRLRALYLEGLMALSRILLQSEAFTELEDVSKAAIRADQLREDAHRILLLAYARTGRRAEALRHFQHLVQFLREELESEPEPETIALADRIRSGGEA